MIEPLVKDLIVLVADKDQENALYGLLTNPQRLQIRPIIWKIELHIQRDPGVWNDAHTFLRSAARQFRYALVMFDHEGSGQETRALEALQQDLEHRLAINGWDDRAKVIIPKPELEVWVWSPSPKVDECLGWKDKQPDLRSQLRQQGFWPEDTIKPVRPKAAFDWALREVRKSRSSAVFRQLAEQVSLKNCQDATFQRLLSILRAWFPPE